MPEKNRALPYGAAALASVTWGFSFLFTKDALKYLDMFQLLGYRFLLAAAFMTVLALARVIRVHLPPKKIIRLLPIALLQPVLYFACETVGVKNTTVSETGVVIALVPVAITLCSVLVLKERLSPAKWLAVGACAAGVVLIILANGFNFSSGGGYLLGVAALLGAVVAAGFYNPLSRKASSECTPMEVTFVMMWAGALAFNAAGLAEASALGKLGGYFSHILDFHVMGGIAYLGILSSVVAFFCLNFALSKLPSTVVGTFVNLAPAVTVFAGVLINGDKMGWLQCAGAALIVLGIWGTARRRREGQAEAALPVQPD